MISLDNRIRMDPNGNMLSTTAVRLRLKTVTQKIVVLQTHKLYRCFAKPRISRLGQLLAMYQRILIREVVVRQLFLGISRSIQAYSKILRKEVLSVKLLVGIDVSSKNLDVCFLDSEDTRLKEETLSNDLQVPIR